MSSVLNVLYQPFQQHDLEIWLLRFLLILYKFQILFLISIDVNKKCITYKFQYDILLFNKIETCLRFIVYNLLQPERKSRSKWSTWSKAIVFSLLRVNKNKTCICSNYIMFELPTPNSPYACCVKCLSPTESSTNILFLWIRWA